MGWSKKIYKLVVMCLAVSLLITSAGCAIVTAPAPQEAATTPPEATETLAPTITPTPEPRYGVQDSSEAFTSTQKILNESKHARVQKERIQRWLDYWIKFDDRPFAVDSADIHWKYIYNNAKSPSEVWVLLEVGGEYKNKLFTVPMNENGFVDYPPAVTGKTIEAGLGPLEINPNKDGTILSVKDGVPVRINLKGDIVEKLVKAQWEVVEKYPIDLEKLHNFPESVDYLKSHEDEFVEAPDPMEDFEEFRTWYLDKFIPSLGDIQKRESEWYKGGQGISDTGLFLNIVPEDEINGQPLTGVPDFFYFKDGETYYPVPVITYSDNYGMNRVVALILADWMGNFPDRVQKQLDFLNNPGGKIESIGIIKEKDGDFFEKINILTEKLQTLPKDDWEINLIGVGSIVIH